MLAFAAFTAFVIFALMVAAKLSGLPLTRSGQVRSVPVLALTSLMLAAIIAVIQIGALGLLRLLPWQGPRLEVGGDDPLKRVFE